MPNGLQLFQQEIPSGLTDCVNLSYFTANTFIANSLQVFLDGRRLTPLLDFQENANRDGFDIIVDPLDPNRLNKPLRHNEDLRVDYIREPSSDCITSL